MVKMYKKSKHDKMIDIYESDLEDYFKYLLDRVNNFLNTRNDKSEVIKHQKNYHINKKAS